ncbi:YceI family protein [Herbaspirillum sp. WKF16]|uniref:YceI family protein n=1 Tax=Herbaspirillum sp. WKF16 TaxID=3028312 RepID=UPI0023A9A5C6|nr:YceI family protein [Herbaspirillum sp. WKF16]WDZ96867.1 YceI family protein [Herbaspirillum sp. WKF16]
MTLRSIFKPTLAAIGAAAIAASAHAAPLKVDAAKSSVVATFKQLNVPVDAKFKKFTAAIDFDTAKPEQGKASLDIDISSFDLGEAEYNKEVQKKEWFNAAQFPKATFVASSIKAAGAGKFDVAGKLTIKGKSTDVSFPLAVKKDGAAQVFDGSLPIKRLTYNVGEGEWKDTGMVADEVTIKFHIVAQ